MEIAYFLVDAFTRKAFSGNPAAVCLLTEMLDDELLQNIAREFNQAETAFVLDQGSHYNLRWFSPVKEADLCGHATLAAAHVLWEFGELSDKSITFHTRSGELYAKRKKGEIILNFPKTELQIAVTPPTLAEAIGAMPFGVNNAGPDLLVELASADAVRDAQVNLGLIAQLPIERGVILCAENDDEKHDIICRFFAPKFGIAEDHVTGSAHCALGPYFQSRFKKNNIRSYQASKRGGSVSVKVKDDRVHIGGHARMVCIGTLSI